MKLTLTEIEETVKQAIEVLPEATTVRMDESAYGLVKTSRFFSNSTQHPLSFPYGTFYGLTIKIMPDCDRIFVTP